VGPGVPLQVLHTDYASIVAPIVSFIDELRAHDDRQIVVLIPWSSRTAYAIACSTIRSTSCSLRHYGPALTSWSHESGRHWESWRASPE